MTHAPWAAAFVAIFWTPKEDHRDLRNEVRLNGQKLMEVQLVQREMKGKLDAIMHKTGATQIYNQQTTGPAKQGGTHIEEINANEANVAGGNNNQTH